MVSMVTSISSLAWLTGKLNFLISCDEIWFDGSVANGAYYSLGLARGNNATGVLGQNSTGKPSTFTGAASSTVVSRGLLLSVFAGIAAFVGL